MKRTIRAFLAVAIAAVVLFPGSPAAAETRSERWQARALDAFSRFEAADDGHEIPHTYAFAAQTRAWMYGWGDPQAVAYLDKVRSLRNPDGGWGLGYAYDFAGNGTINPPTTTYTVTLADHVGPVLLDAYKHGAATVAEVKAIVTLIMRMPRIHDAGEMYGQCIAYSNSPLDSGAGMCTHNVNAGAAQFLLDTNAAGVGTTGLMAYVVSATRRETASYREGDHWWKYMDSMGIAQQDADHNSYMAETMYTLAYPIGREVAWWQMTTPGIPDSALAHARLTGLPGGPASMSADGSTTLWCELGDQWFGEFDAWVDDRDAAGDARRLVQAAYYAETAARSCA